MEDVNESFRKNLKARIALADKTPNSLAEDSSVSLDGIYRYLRGEISPRFDTVVKLAEALGCSPNDLIGWN